jgi:hypothetical protein
MRKSSSFQLPVPSFQLQKLQASSQQEMKNEGLKLLEA